MCLFMAATPIFIRGEVLKAFPSRVLLAGNVLMFIVITIHNGKPAVYCKRNPFCYSTRPVSSIIQLVMAFAYQTDIRGPIQVFNDLSIWGTYSAPLLLAMVIWIGDALVVCTSRLRLLGSDVLNVLDIQMFPGLEAKLPRYRGSYPPLPCKRR